MRRTLSGLAVAAALAVAAGCDTQPTTGPSNPPPKDEGKRNTDTPPAPTPAPPK